MPFEGEPTYLFIGDGPPLSLKAPNMHFPHRLLVVPAVILSACMGRNDMSTYQPKWRSGFVPSSGSLIPMVIVWAGMSNHSFSTLSWRALAAIC